MDLLLRTGVFQLAYGNVWSKGSGRNLAFEYLLKFFLMVYLLLCFLLDLFVLNLHHLWLWSFQIDSHTHSSWWLCQSCWNCLKNTLFVHKMNYLLLLDGFELPLGRRHLVNVCALFIVLWYLMLAGSARLICNDLWHWGSFLVYPINLNSLDHLLQLLASLLWVIQNKVAIFIDILSTVWLNSFDWTKASWETSVWPHFLNYISLRNFNIDNRWLRELLTLLLLLFVAWRPKFRLGLAATLLRKIKVRVFHVTSVKRCLLSCCFFNLINRVFNTLGPRDRCLFILEVNFLQRW